MTVVCRPSEIQTTVSLLTTRDPMKPVNFMIFSFRADLTSLLLVYNIVMDFWFIVSQFENIDRAISHK